MTAGASNLQLTSRMLCKRFNQDYLYLHIGNFYLKVLHPLSTSAALI